MRKLGITGGVLVLLMALVLPVVASHPGNSNSADYWEAHYADHQAVCYKHAGDSVHGDVVNQGRAVELDPFNQAWPGDHWEALIVNGGGSDAVTYHPTAGVEYAPPLNPGGQAPDVSHWIVCKGTTPDTTTTTIVEETTTTTVTEETTTTVADTTTTTAPEETTTTAPEVTSTTLPPTTTTTTPSTTTTEPPEETTTTTTVPAVEPSGSVTLACEADSLMARVSVDEESEAGYHLFAFVNGEPTDHREFIANDGSLSIDAPEGSFVKVELYGGDDRLDFAELTVDCEADPTTTTSEPVEELPFTGMDTVAALGIGASAFGLGVLTLLWGLTRKEETA